jgi:hypothetical protein
MVQECAHTFPDGRKCRRIPKRGQPLCPAHQSRPRRAFLEENEAFHREIDVFIHRLDAMPLPELLDETAGLLAGIQRLVDRRSSRRDRLAFVRTNTAVCAAGERLEEALRATPRYASPLSAPPTQPPSTPPPHQPLTPQSLARLERAQAILNSGRMIPPEEFDELISDLDTF